MRVAFVICLVACGRYGFDARGDGHGTSDTSTPFDGMLVFDAPGACIAAMAPASCSTTSSRVTALAASTAHMCAIRDTGLTCWGYNEYGQLGFCTDQLNIDVPIDTFAFSVAQVAVGELHTCARLTDGQAWCWGSRFEGETGDGISMISSPIPRRIGGTWKDLATRRYHTCGVATDGTLWCWGRNMFGQLGLGDSGMANDRGSPQQVGTAVTWDRVWTGSDFTCALDTAGHASCWGDNTDSQLGDGTGTMHTTPMPVGGGHVFASLTLGKNFACGLEAGGNLWCWGRGNEGEMANSMIGAGASENMPALVGGGPYTHAAAGFFHACALDSAGKLSCWGDNSLRTITPVNQDMIATPLGIANGPFIDVTAGSYTTCVRGAAVGAPVQCYGDNSQFQLGIGPLGLQSTLHAVCFGT